MSATKPRISIVMPAHNVAKYVSATIRSVAVETRRDYAFIVVDDGSFDDTPAVLERAAAEWPADAGQLRLLRQDNRGAAAARNAGLDAVSRSLVAFLDADDLWRPELLEALAGRLEADPDLDLLFPMYSYIEGAGRPLCIVSEPPDRTADLRDLLADNPIHSATGVVARRDALVAAGGGRREPRGVHRPRSLGEGCGASARLHRGRAAYPGRLPPPRRPDHQRLAAHGAELVQGRR